MFEAADLPSKGMVQRDMMSLRRIFRVPMVCLVLVYVLCGMRVLMSLRSKGKNAFVSLGPSPVFDCFLQPAHAVIFSNKIYTDGDVLGSD